MKVTVYKTHDDLSGLVGFGVVLSILKLEGIPFVEVVDIRNVMYASKGRANPTNGFAVEAVINGVSTFISDYYGLVMWIEAHGFHRL